MEEEKKPVHSLVLDAGPLISNNPSISSLLKKSEQIFTTPSVLGEIKDANARARVETMVVPFIEVRTPKATSMKFVTDFARKTGDLVVLSKTDLEVIALAYELECERNNGDWRLRNTPGQKRVNGAPPKPDQSAADGSAAQPEVQPEVETKNEDKCTEATVGGNEVLEGTQALQEPVSSATESPLEHVQPSVPESHISEHTTTRDDTSNKSNIEPATYASISSTNTDTEDLASNLKNLEISEAATPASRLPPNQPAFPDSTSDLSSDSNSDSEGWITPSNLKRHQYNTNTNGDPSKSTEPKTLQVATITTDFALQNTLLQINLNLLSPALTRISHLKSTILRCHACFSTTRETNRQFCARCGKPTLTRVTVTTTAAGTTKLHLKKNMQWNTRGDRYSIPKPVAGTASGKMREKGGGKGGWGRGLILAEDQKEFVTARRDAEREKKAAQRDLLDGDFLPGLLGGGGVRGSATGGSGRIQIGAGRNVNSRKRRG
jgi:RNA-binding protein NOB1